MQSAHEATEARDDRPRVSSTRAIANVMKMLVVAELPENVESEMTREVRFDEAVSIGEIPLG